MPIHRIQGAGASSPLAGEPVTVTGIVTGDFQYNDARRDRELGGFYLQSEKPDSDPQTSEGIFVYEGPRTTADVTEGDRVVVEGVVAEYGGETQIDASSVTVTGKGEVRAAELELPAELEHFEGMLVRLPQTLVVTGLRELERYGSLQLIAGERAYAYTQRHPPDAAGYAAHQAELASRSLILDDGMKTENVWPIAHLRAARERGHALRAGDAVTGLTGNLRYAAGGGDRGAQAFRLVPSSPPKIESRNPRPAVPDVGGALRIAALNTLNFFSSIDSGRDNCGLAGSSGCRGADSAREFERQIAKLVTALEMLDADIVGLVEIENNGGVALQLIVERLNAAGGDLYDYVDSGIIGGDVIAVGFLYRSSTIDLRGEPVLLDSRVDRRFDDRLNRPVLAQAFEHTATGATFSLAIAHLKSKGSSCGPQGDPDRKDGQGNCNRTRLRAASAIADWLETDPTGSGDADYLLLGDLNAYGREDPLDALRKAGLRNLLASSGDREPWTFVYAGQAGALDHAFATASFAEQVTGAAVWHINADEPPVLDYNTEFGREPLLFDASSPYRVSDHDPLLIGLDPQPISINLNEAANDGDKR